MRPIGGFLPLRLPRAAPGPRSLLACWRRDGDAWLLHSARSALRALWQATRPPRIWLPAYVCGEVAAAAEGMDVRYFPVGERLEADTDFLARHVAAGDHVLAVDYFGRPPGRAFVALVAARPDVGWIEDRAQALDPGEPWGDWLLYSPRKVVGVPDGGILVGRRKALPTLAATPVTDLAFMLPALERYEDVDESANDRWYATYVRAERAVPFEAHAMSRLATAILDGIDRDADARTRRDNYAALHARLARWALFADARVGFAPLGFPLVVPAATGLSAALAERRIFAARHWPTLPSPPHAFPAEHRLSEQLLTLPCDDRYGPQDMQRVADAVVGLLAARPA